MASKSREQSKGNPLKSPFRQSTLLSVGSFRSHCDKCGIRVSLKELEALHKEGLLYPAVRVRLGYQEHCKILANHKGREQWLYIYPHDIEEFETIKMDENRYFMTGTLMTGGKDWMDRWYSKDEIDHPADLPYFQWERRHNAGEYTTDKKEIENDYELLYDKRQMLALKIIQQWRKYQLPDDDPKEYDQKLRERLAEFYRFLALYIETEHEWEQYRKWRPESYKELVDEYKGDEKEAEQEWLARHEARKVPEMNKWANRLLRKYGFTTKDVHRWQIFLAQQSFLNAASPSHRASKTYLLALDDNVLIKAEDTNYMVFVVNQLLYMLTGELRTVQNVIGHFLEARCEICRMPIERDPRVQSQFTCGKTPCKNAHRNAKKRRDRKKKTDKVASQRHT